jgi:SAM-dependent methyltransferase
VRCRACGGATEAVFEMAPMPLAGAFAETRDEALASPRYPLTWSSCRTCGLVNVTPDIDDAILYSAYRYAASEVPALVRHHAEYAAFLKARHPGIVRLLEIGSNDGVLLNQLPVEWETIGVDPSDINSPGTRIRERFTFGLAQALGKFDVVTSSNAFAHFSGIEDAIEGIAKCLKPDGSAYIEVHDLDATLDSGQWDTIYHEHKVEWSVASLRSAFAAKGLWMVDARSLPLHGGLIRAEFRKGKPRGYGPVIPEDFAPLRRAYETRTAPALPEGSVAYGAAARASVYLNQVETGVGYVVDGSSRRAGRYVPGVGLRIATPAEFEGDNPPAALITAWNHAADIRARHPQYDRWVTAW